MILSITIGYWMIPTLITIVSLYWALCVVNGGDGLMSGLANLFALVPALGISLVSWIIFSIVNYLI